MCRSQSSRQAWGRIDGSRPERRGGASLTSHQRTEVVGLLAAGPNFTGTDVSLPLQQSFKGDRAEPRRSERRHSRYISSVQTQTLSSTEMAPKITWALSTISHQRDPLTWGRNTCSPAPEPSSPSWKTCCRRKPWTPDGLAGELQQIFKQEINTSPI